MSKKVRVGRVYLPRLKGRNYLCMFIGRRIAMEVLLYIAAIVAAIAFLILCISLAMTLGSLKTTLRSVSETMDGLTNQLEGITSETTELLHKTNALAEDIQQKSEKLNTVVDAVKGVGSSVSDLNNSVRRVTNSITVEAEKNSDKIAQVVQWSNVAFGIIGKVKDMKTERSSGWTVYQPDKRQKRLPSPEGR